MRCTAPQEIENCYFEIPGMPQIEVYSGAGNSQFEDLGSNFDTGECGIRVFNAELKHEGVATCIVTYPFVNTELKETIDVVISGRPPSSMKMTASNRYFEFQERNDMEFTCKISGTSSANISILLGSQKQLKNGQK